MVNKEKLGTSSSAHLQFAEAEEQDAAQQQRFSSVDGKLFWWLLRYPLQRVEDLVLALQVSPNTVYRHLTKLIEEGLIECITPSLGAKATCRLYYLSNGGLLASAAREQADAHTLARTWRANEQGILRLLPRLSTLVRLQDLVNGLVAGTPAMLSHARGYHADIAWHWTRYYQHRFLFQERPIVCSADAALLLHRKAPLQTAQDSGKAEYYCALLFCDPGLAGYYEHHLIAQRLAAIIRYRDSRGGLSAQMFPPVIVLVQKARQRDIWQLKTAEVATSLRANPLAGAIAIVPAQETLEAAWTLPWQKLSVPTSCRLREIFTPLPKDALLPGLLQQRSAPPTPAPSSATKKGRILWGDFARRAREINLASDNDGDREHENLALLRLRLSQRHLAVLEMLYEYPLLATEELAILQDVQTDSAVRYLFELRRYSCIEKCETERGTRWHVAPRGLRLIAAIHNVSLQHITGPIKDEAEDTEGTIVQHGVARLKRRIEYTAGIYTFFASLHRSARAQGPDHVVEWWETGIRCEHRYQDHGTRHILRPDGAFAYKTQQARLLAWLEWDEGTRGKQVVAARMTAYAHYARMREWRAAGLQTLPVLLIVAPDQGRYQHVAQAASEYLAGSGFLVRMTTAKLLATGDPLAAIWSQIVPVPPDQNPSGTGRRALLDLSKQYLFS